MGCANTREITTKTSAIGELKMNGGTFGAPQLARNEAAAKAGKLTGPGGAIHLLHSILTLNDIL